MGESWRQAQERVYRIRAARVRKLRADGHSLRAIGRMERLSHETIRRICATDTRRGVQ